MTDRRRSLRPFGHSTRRSATGVAFASHTPMAAQGPRRRRESASPRCPALTFALLAVLLGAPWSDGTRADPAPFGLELGRATLARIGARYPLLALGTDRYTGGAAFALDPTRLGLDGLQRAILVFDHAGVLGAVLLDLPAERFPALLRTLSGKYRRVEGLGQAPGGLLARFADGGTEIALSAPRLGLHARIDYVRRDLSEAAERRRAAEEAMGRAGEGGHL